jgi:hypothetical protein
VRSRGLVGTTYFVKGCRCVGQMYIFYGHYTLLQNPEYGLEGAKNSITLD